MSVINGRDAYVNGIPCTESWQLSKSADVKTYAASCTGGATGAAAGNVNWTGQINGLGAEPPSGVWPGNDLTFKGVVDNTVSDNITYDGTVRINQLTITLPVVSGDVCKWSATFGAQGDMAKTTIGAADATFKEHYSANGTGVTVGAGETVIPDVQDVTLVFNTPETTFINAGLTYRRSGNLEANCSFNILNREFGVSPWAVNYIDLVKFYISDVEYWEIAWIRWKEMTGLVVDASSRALVGYTINGVFSSVKSAVNGYITSPSGFDFYGTHP